MGAVLLDSHNLFRHLFIMVYFRSTKYLMLKVACTNCPLCLLYHHLFFQKILYFLNATQLLVSSLLMITLISNRHPTSPGQNVSKLYLKTEMMYLQEWTINSPKLRFSQHTDLFHSFYPSEKVTKNNFKTDSQPKR